MKKALLSFLLSCCAGVTMAQNIPNWENPEVFAVNKEETRATSIPYPDENMALKNDYEASPWYRPLDGMWKFRWVPTVAEIPVGFEQESYDMIGAAFDFSEKHQIPVLLRITTRMAHSRAVSMSWLVASLL